MVTFHININWCGTHFKKNPNQPPKPHTDPSTDAASLRMLNPLWNVNNFVDKIKFLTRHSAKAVQILVMPIKQAWRKLSTPVIKPRQDVKFFANEVNFKRRKVFPVERALKVAPSPLNLALKTPFSLKRLLELRRKLLQHVNDSTNGVTRQLDPTSISPHRALPTLMHALTILEPSLLRMPSLPRTSSTASTKPKRKSSKGAMASSTRSGGVGGDSLATVDQIRAPMINHLLFFLPLLRLLFHRLRLLRFHLLLLSHPPHLFFLLLLRLANCLLFLLFLHAVHLDMEASIGDCLPELGDANLFLQYRSSLVLRQWQVQPPVTQVPTCQSGKRIGFDVRTRFVFFLVADTQLYKSLCPSVYPSVHPSVGPWTQVGKWGL